MVYFRVMVFWMVKDVKILNSSTFVYLSYPRKMCNTLRSCTVSNCLVSSVGSDNPFNFALMCPIE